MLENLCLVQIEKPARVGICVKSLHSRDDVWRQEIRLLQVGVIQRHLVRTHRRFSCRSGEIEIEDRPAAGAPSKKKNRRQKAAKMPKTNSNRGDCTRWTTKGQGSLGDACAFMHDPNKKGKGKRRLLVHVPDRLTAPKFERRRKGW